MAPTGETGTLRKPLSDDNVIDYFVVSKGLAMAGAAAHVDLETEPAPHRPVQLSVALSGRTVPQLQVPKIAELERVVGPLPEPSARAISLATDFGVLCDAVRDDGVARATHAKELDQLCADWYKEAYAELAAATGAPATKYKAPRIRWVAPATLDQPRKERDGCGITQWALDRLEAVLRLFIEAGGRMSGWRGRVAAIAARISSTPSSASWSDEAEELVSLTRQLVADMQQGPVPEQRRADLRTKAVVAAAQLEAARAAKHLAARASWRSWADAAVDAGASAAHAYLRGADQKREDDSVRSFRDELDAQHAEWAPRWAPPDRSPIRDLVVNIVSDGWRHDAPVAVGADVLDASRSFPKKTAWGPDGLHVRQYMHLSQPLLEGAARMINLHAAAGLAPAQAMLVAAPLIPKPQGGGGPPP